MNSFWLVSPWPQSQKEPSTHSGKRSWSTMWTMSRDLLHTSWQVWPSLRLNRPAKISIVCSTLRCKVTRYYHITCYVPVLEKWLGIKLAGTVVWILDLTKQDLEAKLRVWIHLRLHFLSTISIWRLLNSVTLNIPFFNFEMDRSTRTTELLFLWWLTRMSSSASQAQEWDCPPPLSSSTSRHK